MHIIFFMFFADLNKNKREISIRGLTNLSSICIWSIYIFQLIRYFRACCFPYPIKFGCHDITEKMVKLMRRVWGYQRGNQNPYIEEKQTTQWPKEKVQHVKQRSTKHTLKTKDRVTRTPLKTGGERRCFGGVSSSCSTSGTRRVNLVTNLVISHE